MFGASAEAGVPRALQARVARQRPRSRTRGEYLANIDLGRATAQKRPPPSWSEGTDRAHALAIAYGAKGSEARNAEELRSLYCT